MMLGWLSCTRTFSPLPFLEDWYNKACTLMSRCNTQCSNLTLLGIIECVWPFLKAHIVFLSFQNDIFIDFCCLLYIYTVFVAACDNCYSTVPKMYC